MGADERLRPSDRLRREAEYRRCYRQGRRQHGRLVTLHSVPNDLGRPRFGITVGRRVGGAVVRQRCKRRVREIVRRWPQRRALPGLDLVIHLEPAAATAPFGTLRQELERLLAKHLDEAGSDSWRRS